MLHPDGVTGDRTIHLGFADCAKLLWRLLLALVLLNGLLGCVSPLVSNRPASIETPGSQVELPGAHLSFIEVRWVGSVAEPNVDTPPKGWAGGARRGAWLGASVPLKAGVVGAAVGVALENGSGGGVFLGMASLAAGIALLPAGAVVGAVVGVAKAEPAEKIEGAQRALSNVAEERRVGELVRDYVIELGRERTPAAFVAMLADEDVPDGVVEVAVTRLALKQFDFPGQGLFNLSEGWGGDPPLQLELAIHARLRRPGGDELAAREFVYRSGVQRFGEWTAGGAAPFGEELERGGRSLADDIVTTWFAKPKTDATPGAESDRDRQGEEGP